MRAVKSLVAIVLASLIGTVPSCGTMGGGMRYLVDPAPARALSLAL
jgi:hypothetical protein